ncbi:TetR family transcriptional regulator [Ramlibacter sp. 2FC]|uniref:TetR family transcriptional regulator n=1 Tax=Ramlibacter sp. 2FC TaxID=2502188 RepID=UPI0010F92DC3|nr:TetR family transcriptional regulator [Ramlibacter sp. 2FC]
MNTRSTARAAAGRSGTARKPGVRELAAQATRDSLLRAAIKVFSKQGLDGGSVEQISKAAKSYDRMIYYYFGNKEGLYLAALEEIYRRFNDAESALELNLEQPVASLQAVVRFILNYYRKNPEFVALLNTENMHRGKHIGKSLRAREYSSPAIGVIEQLLKSGAAQGMFRNDLSARDLYLMIAALGYFYQSNRFTLSAFLGENLDAPEATAHWEAFVTDAVLRTVASHSIEALQGLDAPSAPGASPQAT